MGKDSKKVLITGGAGFIGSNLAKSLLNYGYEITILDNFLPQIHGNINMLDPELRSKVKLIIGDVTDKNILYSALSGQNIIVHYAAETGTGQSMYDVSRYTNVNIQATANLCNFLINEEHKIEKVILASSRSIYGEGKYFSKSKGFVYPNSRSLESIKNSFEVTCPFNNIHDLELCATDESSKIHPSSFYGITKQVQEQMVILSCKITNINAYALRYQNVFGPGQSLKNPYTGILSIFTRLALINEDIIIFEDGKESRDFIYIDDVINATVKCINHNQKGQFVLNVGSGVATTVLEVANEIVSYLKSNSKISICNIFREGDIRHNKADLGLIKSVLGFEVEWDFKKGLHMYIDWVLKQKDIPSSIDDYKKSLIELETKGLLRGKI